MSISNDSMRVKVNLIYFDRQYNFGDELSKVIVSYLLNNSKYELVFNQPDVEMNIVGVGSYIHCAKQNSFIFGSGVRTNPPIEKMKDCHSYVNLNVCAVRGPLTKAFLENKHIAVPDVFGDPALLLPMFFKPMLQPFLSNKIGIIPHKDTFAKYQNLQLNEQFYLISPMDPWEQVINSICSCKSIISSSLHGLICSDAYSIPNVWLDEYPLREGDFKFRDYFLSQGRSYIKISNLNEFNENILYTGGNTIDLNSLKDSFPFS